MAFSPNGRILAVTEKATQTIDTFVLGPNRRPSAVHAQHSEGATPFGFERPRRPAYVSEAPTSSASSYDVAADGTIDPITSVLSNGQGAACWLVVSSDGDHAYTANAATANVTPSPGSRWTPATACSPGSAASPAWRPDAPVGSPSEGVGEGRALRARPPTRCLGEPGDTFE